MCKTIVEAYGGIIEIDSEPGKGTTVIFTIPVYGGQADRSEAAGMEQK
jgi:signal transduction histidine kinase